jgi:hypothetical protein
MLLVEALHPVPFPVTVDRVTRMVGPAGCDIARSAQDENTSEARDDLKLSIAIYMRCTVMFR